MAIVGFVATESLIEHKHQKIEVAASISAKGLASIIDERISQHRLIVQAISMHHSDRIYALAEGGGYPFDLAFISDEIKTLLPDTLQFAILNAKGTLVVGSNDLRIGLACQSEIEHTIVQNNTIPSLLQTHTPPNRELHYDVVHKLKRGEDVAGLFLSFNLDTMKQLLTSFNTADFEFMMFDAHRKGPVITSANQARKSLYRQVIETGELKHSLSTAPIMGTEWSLLAYPKPGIFKHHAHQVRLTAVILFLTIFGIALWLVLYLKGVEKARKQLEEDSVQDALFNSGPTVLFQKKTSQNMPIQYVSPNVKDLLGCKQETVQAQNYTSLILAQDQEKVRSAISNAYVKQTPEVELEYRLKRQGSEDFCWVNDVTHIQYDNNGHPTGLQSYVNSVHAQKMAEQRANNLIENAPDAIAVTNKNGAVIRVNHAFETLFGYNRHAMIGRSIEVCIDPNSQVIFEAFKQAFLNKKSSYYSSLGGDTPLLAKTQDSKKLPVEVSLSSMNSLEGLQIVHIIRDVSVQIEAQKQMKIAKENAEGLAKARSRFVATMSHEIRTPLNGVLGMSNLLHNTPLNQQQESYLSAIEYSGQSLLKIINEILDFAKLDEGKLRLESKELDMGVIVRECMLILQTKAQDNRVMVSFENSLNDSETFLGDASRIQQILLNILGNAIKFSPGGQVDIVVSQVESEQSEAGLTTVLIEVKDTGIGIDQDTLPRLFDSFSQADESTTRQFGGTGLGLTITKQLVDLMGGEIGVTSKLSHGSQFWVKLPFKTVIKTLTVDQIGTQSNKINLAPESNGKLVDKTVLLIEDNEINQQVIYEYLKRLGAKVDIAENGVEGLSFWRTHPKKYELILMDCQMPLMDGYEATRMIRKEEDFSGVAQRIPIVALTANAMNEDKERCLEVGMDDFIAKPIEINSFNNTVVKWGTVSHLPL